MNERHGTLPTPHGCACWLQPAAMRPSPHITLGRLVWWSGSGEIQACSQRPTGFLQCFDTVGLVIWPVKLVSEMTYNVLSGTLSFYALTHPCALGK